MEKLVIVLHSIISSAHKNYLYYGVSEPMQTVLLHTYALLTAYNQSIEPLCHSLLCTESNTNTIHLHLHVPTDIHRQAQSLAQFN